MSSLHLTLKSLRTQKGLSQRKLALKAHVAYKTAQLIEIDSQKARLNTLTKILQALGFSAKNLQTCLIDFLTQEKLSIHSTSKTFQSKNDPNSWTFEFFEFTDEFKRSPRRKLIDYPPTSEISPQLLALLASSVETLCDDLNWPPPWWCAGVLGLELP